MTTENTGTNGNSGSGLSGNEAVARAEEQAKQNVRTQPPHPG